MDKKYLIQKNPFIVPTNDGKSIKEHFGLASENAGDCSIAHMIAPPGWAEPYQKPEFDEITFVFSGKKMITIDETEEIVLKAGESILIKKHCRVKYSNPFDEPTQYISICMPAFSLETVHREA